MTLILPMLLMDYTPLEKCMLFHCTTSCVRILPLKDKWPSLFAWHLSRNRDIALATDLFILTAHPFLGDKLWRCSG